jgi:phosphoribosyl-ATP pyrophosphohydrolase/phosphoribosyl-AMP cyclohydrolase/histidinol dehydrogenase
MSVSFLPLVDSLHNALKNSLIAHTGAVFSQISPNSLDSSIEALSQIAIRLQVYLDATSVTSTDDVVSLLDAGASKVIVNFDQLGLLEKVDTIDQDRLVLQISGSTKAAIVEAIGGKSIGVYWKHTEDVELVEAWLSEYGDENRPPVLLSFENIQNDHVYKVASLGAIPVIPHELLAIGPETGSSFDPAMLLLSRVKSDRPDGLITTLVTDERGIALGLVYSSSQSVKESLKTGRGVYQSRKRGLWYKGESSGDIQQLIKISLDCDSDCLLFTVRQLGKGFCHLGTSTCFGNYSGLSKLQKTLEGRRASAPQGSYTSTLFKDPELLKAKLMEEAGELCEAKTKEDVAFEAADLIYFALTKCVASGVTLDDVEKNLDAKSLKVKRRPGNAKVPLPMSNTPRAEDQPKPTSDLREVVGKIRMKTYVEGKDSRETILEALRRPSQRSSEAIMGIVEPIVKDIQSRGDKALLEYTHKFEKATSLTSPVLKAPFSPDLMKLSTETKDAIDTSFANIQMFHAAQMDKTVLQVETMPGVVCSRFSRPIERVGLYVPGGTAVLPSTAMMLGVPALVAGCSKIVIASPPRSDGSVTPEIIYIAHKVGAESIVLAGGAQAIAAMAYGTEEVSKVDKILGPGNQFVTAAKMLVSNDTNAAVAIDMPAGPSEVLVIADQTANPAFVAADLLSQAEHGVDSQVVLIAVGLSQTQIAAIEEEVDSQAMALPRVDIVRKAIEHSVTVVVENIHDAFELSNIYAPEHLILQIKDAEQSVALVQNAGSVFIGPWTPESVGDYSAGVNHSLRKWFHSYHKLIDESSNLWICETILRCKSRVLCEAYYIFKSHGAGPSQCR